MSLQFAYIGLIPIDEGSFRMECSSDQRRRDEEAARAYMEQMTDGALSRIIDMMREAVETSPRPARPALEIVKNQEGNLPEKK